MEKQEETSPYEPPRVVDYGDLVELTAGDANGENLDATYPLGTPRGKLGFSG
jgi:hypothetical protein